MGADITTSSTISCTSDLFPTKRKHTKCWVPRWQRVPRIKFQPKQSVGTVYLTLQGSQGNWKLIPTTLLVVQTKSTPDQQAHHFAHQWPMWIYSCCSHCSVQVLSACTWIKENQEHFNNSRTFFFFLGGGVRGGGLAGFVFYEIDLVPHMIGVQEVIPSSGFYNKFGFDLW